MIEYDPERWFGTLHYFGSVLPRSVPQALVSLVLTVLLVEYADYEQDFYESARSTPLGAVGESVIYNFTTNAYVHQISMLSISLIIAFRVNLAYSRYWEGIGLLLNMRSKWVDAFTQVVAFDEAITSKDKPPPNPSVADFRVLLAHLFSMMHACAVLEVKKLWDVRCFTADMPSREVRRHSALAAALPWLKRCVEKPVERHELIKAEVLGGVASSEQEELRVAGRGWVEFMHLRIVRVISDRIVSGGLAMPPPILSRIFQELSTGTLMCTGAQKISQIPFPFPFYEMVRLLKVYFIVSNPFVLVSFTTSPLIAISLSFLASLFFVAIIEVAEELEDPFGEDPNDLPLMELHAEYNEIITKMVFNPRLPIDSLRHPDGAAFRAQLRDSMAERFGQSSADARYEALVTKVKKTSEGHSGRSSSRASNLAADWLNQGLRRPSLAPGEGANAIAHAAVDTSRRPNAEANSGFAFSITSFGGGGRPSKSRVAS